jgi:hypothetical protein
MALFTLTTIAFGFAVGRLSLTLGDAPIRAQSKSRVFELRTYTTNEGKLDALQNRFRGHTMKLFEKHGMTNVGYWVPAEGPLARNTLIYIISHPSREAAKKNWAEFGSDPEWKRVARDSEAEGKIVSKVNSIFMDATDYSPLR